MADVGKMKYRYFFLSFAISFLVLSLSFFLLMNAVHPATPKSLTTEATAESIVYIPTKEDALSVLFVGLAPDSAEADTFILARFDPARGAVPITVLPRQTAVDNKGKTESLAQVYKYGGADYTRTVLAETLNIPIDRYVRMETTAFITAADTIGTVEFNLGQEVRLGQSGAMPITLNRGIQLLNGQTAADLIHNDGYGGGELSRCSVTADLTATIVNQRIDVVLSTMVDKIFEKIINLVDTDISYVDYDNRKDAAIFLARLEKDPAVAVKVQGQYSADGELYTLTDTFIALLTQTYL